MTPFWLSIIAIGAVDTVVVGALALVRREFLGRLNRLQLALEAGPRPPAARADLPSEVQALALRLGATTSGSGRRVRLTQSGEMWTKPGAKPLAFTLSGATCLQSSA